MRGMNGRLVGGCFIGWDGGGKIEGAVTRNVKMVLACPLHPLRLEVELSLCARTLPL